MPPAGRQRGAISVLFGVNSAVGFWSCSIYAVSAVNYAFIFNSALHVTWPVVRGWMARRGDDLLAGCVVRAHASKTCREQEEKEQGINLHQKQLGRHGLLVHTPAGFVRPRGSRRHCCGDGRRNLVMMVAVAGSGLVRTWTKGCDSILLPPAAPDGKRFVDGGRQTSVELPQSSSINL